MTGTPPPLPTGERLRRAGVASWAAVGVFILAAVGLWALYKVRIIFPPLVLGLLIVYMLNPLVANLERRGVRRGIGAVLIYVVVLGAVVTLVLGLAPFFARQAQEFADDWPNFRREAAHTLVGMAESVNDLGLAIDTDQIYCLLAVDRTADADAPSPERCHTLTSDLREGLTSEAGRIGEIGFTVLEGVLVFVIAPLIALYMLIDLPKLQRDLLHLVPLNYRDETADLAGKVGRILGSFFRGQLFLAFVVGALSSIGFWAVDLPFWLIVGVMVGILNLVPVFGGLLGGVFAFAVAGLVGQPQIGVLSAIVVLAVQQIHNRLLHPIVMRSAVPLHPVSVIVSILAGGAVAGLWGILLSVPAVSVAKLLLAHFWETRVLGAEVTPFGPHARGRA
ncbi:MAG TPA: AI-2E family transporter [Actinomycetota bacterium]|jgi:predicted PurR-regulated permease PerM